MHASNALGAIVRGWWIMLLAVAITAAAAGAFAVVKHPEYQSSGAVAVVTKYSQTAGPLLPPEEIDYLLSTLAAQVSSPEIRSRVVVALGGHFDGSISGSNTTGEGILRFSVRAGSKPAALSAARALQTIVLARLSAVGTGLQSEIIESPALPRTAVEPRPPLIVAFGLLLGLVLGCAIAVPVDRMRYPPPRSSGG